MSAPFAYADTQSSASTVSSAAPVVSTYTIQSGDTLWKIAQKTGVPVAGIVAYNGIANPNALQIGQVLKIPATYTVKTGDTLWKIAQATGTSVQRIVQANSMSNADQIQVGAVLIIPKNDTTYAVKSGDTLWKISQATGVSVQALVQANGLANANQLFIGQVLVVPGTPATTTGAAAGGTATGTSAVTGTAPTSGLTGVQASVQLDGVTIWGNKWIVGSTDTLATIAKATGVPVATIEVLNSLSAGGQLAVGSVVLIPDGTVTTVQSGNTLYTLSQTYGVSVATLAKANQLTTTSSLSVGQSVFVPAQEWVTPTQTVPSTGPSAPRSDVAVLLPDGSKASLPYTYKDSTVQITFNFLTRDALNMTMTNMTQNHSLALLMNTMWYVTGSNQYEEPYPAYISASFGVQYAGNGRVTGGVSANTGGAISGPGGSVSGSIGFGVFGADNGKFTLHYTVYDSTTGSYDNQQITFLTGTNATGQTATNPATSAAIQANLPSVTVAQSMIHLGQTDAVTVTPSPSTGQQVTYQVEALRNGNASTASVGPNTGLFTAQEPGLYVVKATVDGVTSKDNSNSPDRILVLGDPTTFVFDKSSYQLKAGSSSVTMYVTVGDKNQEFLPDQTVTFQSDNPNLVSISSSSVQTNANGVATVQLTPGSGTGSAHITVTSGNASAVVSVQVS